MKQKIDYNILLIAGILVGGYFVGSSILEKLGIKESAQDRETKAKLKEQEKKFNIWGGVNSLRKTAGTRTNIFLLTKQGAEFFAKQINKAFGVFNDNEQAIYGVFRQLRYKSQVASIVSEYYNLYKKDLLTTLKNELSDAEMSEIINIIETKPLGISNK